MWTVQSTKHQQQQQPKPDGENENGNAVAGGWWETNGIKMHTKFVWKKGIGDSSAFAVAQHLHTNFFFFLCLFWLRPFFSVASFVSKAQREIMHLHSLSPKLLSCNCYYYSRRTTKTSPMQWSTRDIFVSSASPSFGLLMHLQTVLCLFENLWLVNTIKTAEANSWQRQWQFKETTMKDLNSKNGIYKLKANTLDSVRENSLNDRRDEVRACDQNLQNRLREYYYSIFVGGFVFIFLCLRLPLTSWLYHKRSRLTRWSRINKRIDFGFVIFRLCRISSWCVVQDPIE